MNFTKAIDSSNTIRNSYKIKELNCFENVHATRHLHFTKNKVKGGPEHEKEANV